jgi:hypothetical protein
MVTIGVIVALAIGVVMTDLAYLTLFPSTGLSVGTHQPLVTFFGTMTVNSGSGVGVLSLEVRNAANSPFVGIEVSSISPSFAGVVDNLVFIYNGTAVSESSPLPIGASANGTYDFGSGADMGSIYSIIATVTLSDGQTVTSDATINVQT